MKRSILLISFIFSSYILMSQAPSFEGNKSTSSVLLQKVVPPSPTAASLGKYGDQQINLFTGTSAVNIPIYEIKTNGFSIPLSLAYSTSGLRVTEAASWVGLGWSLAGTGVVTRIVKGMPDGIRNPIDIRSWPLPLTYTNVSDNAWNYIHSQLQVPGLDPEPDIFIAKAGKLNVKFYYDMHKRIQTIPYNNDIKIKFDGALDQYIITDDDGTQYFFGGSQSTEVTYSSNPSYAAYTTSWFLSKIITPLGAQVLYNNVKGTNFITQDQYSESEEVKPNGQTGDCAGATASGRTTQWSVQDFLPVFLNTIETDQEIVYLTRDVTERADMPGDYALTGIKVYSKSSGKFEYNFSFAYSYFPQVSTICWGNTSSPQHIHNRTAICKRLKLDQFIEKGFEGNAAGFKTYQFQYSTKAVPSRCSLDQDFWGYYNGAGNTSLLPSVSDPDFQTSTYNAVSRESNHNYSDAGMLQKIIYPTGGETNFVYEPNEVNSISPGPTFQTVTASLSGISPSFENSVTFNITNTQLVTINFTLSDPNLLDQGLQRKVEIIDQGGSVRYFAINSNSHPNGILVSGNSTPIGGLTPGTYTLKVSRNYSYSSYPSLTPVSLIASVVYAPSSSVTVVSRKIGGFKIKKVLDKSDPTGADVNLKEFFYENPYFVANIKNPDCLSNYNRWDIAYVSGNPHHTYQCYFRSRTTSSVQPIGSVQGAHIAYGKVTCSYGTNGSNGKTEFFYSTDGDQGGFSLTPFYRPITSYDHRRGNLLSQIDYNSSGIIKRIKTNNYDVTLKYAGIFSSAYYTRDESPIGLFTPSFLPYKVISFTDFAVPSEWVRIKNTAETIFEGSTYISTIKEFNYDNLNYSYVTQTKTTNSKGNVIAEINKYPLDSKPVSTKSNEEIERQFETDYLTLFNSFVSCNNAAANATAVNACYTTYQSGYDNLVNNRATALANYQGTFTTLANGTSDPILKAKYQLIAKNKISELIESRVTKDVSTELSKATNDFKDFSGNILLEKVNKSVSGNALANEITVNSYDSYGNILQATPKDGIIRSFIWDYQYKFPIAEISNASTTNIAYTSFEADGKGSWIFTGMPVTDATAPTGRKAYNLVAGNITKSITSTTIYSISYWRPASLSALTITGTQAGYPVAGRTVNGWKYYEHKITGQTTATIGGSGLIDELRLYPSNALMQTSTFEPLKGVTSRCDAGNRITYYDFDAFGRLMLIRDQDRNILKKICYNYAGHPENCDTWVNTAKSGTYQKTGCSGCQIGSMVTYTVAEGLYSSSISSTDANQKAQDDVNANGPAFANANGTCTAPGTVPVSGTNGISATGFSLQFHNNCTNINYNFTLNGGATNVSLSGMPQANYTVTISSNGGGSTQYTYRVNGFTQHTMIANITVDLVPTGNQVLITP